MTATAARVTTPDVERELVFDMLRRGLPFAPLVVVASGLLRGSNGAWSALVAIAVVTVNFLLSALALAWAARTSPTALMATALGGFLARMMLVTLVVVAVRHQTWIDLPALAVAILVTHLGLLFWELRYVGATLAFPGIKPPQTGA
ncbi:MAG: ATP synthase subunit I [Acidimicrobiales bacterium]